MYFNLVCSWILSYIRPSLLNFMLLAGWMIQVHVTIIFPASCLDEMYW